MSGKPATMVERKSARLAALALAASLAVLAGCSSPGGKWGFPYRADVQQGNWITQEQISLLRVGMTREQVRFALGSPHPHQRAALRPLGLPYYFKPGYGDVEERKFTVWFQNDQLARWSGDEQPELQPFQIEKAKAEGAGQSE